MAMSPAKITSEQEDQMFRLLRQLDIASDGSQRVTAAAIGVSLGRLNALLKQATDAKLVKITDRNGPDKRALWLCDHLPWCSWKEPAHRSILGT